MFRCVSINLTSDMRYGVGCNYGTGKNHFVRRSAACFQERSCDYDASDVKVGQVIRPGRLTLSKYAVENLLGWLQKKDEVHLSPVSRYTGKNGARLLAITRKHLYGCQ